MGHHVLAVPVPQLERFVRGRWQHYEPTWVSTDRAFTHAHVTALSPFLAEPTVDDLVRVADVAAGIEAFEFCLHEVQTFPNGVLHLPPDPPEPFEELTRRLAAAFPQCPPYAGRYRDVAPHLTLDWTSDTVTPASTRRLLGDDVPVTCRAERLELQWYEMGGACRVVRSWEF